MHCRCCFVDKVLVLLAPIIETLLKLLIRWVIALPAEWEGSAAGRVTHVVQVGNDVETKSTRIAKNVGDAIADANVAGEVVNRRRAAAGEPVLGRSVAVAKDDGRQARNGISLVRDAEHLAGLAGGKVGKLVVADAGRAVRVDVARVAGLAEVRGAQVGDGAAERVAGDDDLVARVGGQALVDGAGGSVGDFVPGVGEAGVDLAAAGEAAVLLFEDDVCDEVADVVAAADGDDNLAADVINGGVAGDASS